MFRTGASAAALLQEGFGLFQAGRLDQAEASCRHALLLQPNQAEALHLLALIAHRRGRLDEAAERLNQAIKANRNEARYQLDLGSVEAARGRIDAARAAWRRAQRLAERSPEALLAIGAAQGGAGCMEDAAASFRLALKLDPKQPAAQNNLGSALALLGRFAEAAEAYRAALVLAPDYLDARLNLANALASSGQGEAAVEAYRAAAERHPESAPAQRGLGDALTPLGRLDEAAEAYRAAVRLDPTMAEAHNNLGLALCNLGRREEAEAVFAEAIRQSPALLAARANLAAARLPIIYRDEAEIERARAAYAADLAALVEAPLPAGLNIGAVGGIPPFYLAYQGRDDRELQALYGRSVSRIMAALHPDWMVAPDVRPPRPGERIRVGILSAYFFRHSNWKIPIKGWLEGLDRRRFELYGYHIGGKQDAETAAAAALCHRFSAESRPLAGWAAAIRADRLHVLLIPGIGMDPMTTELAALKLAPVQATSWGHPETSGLASIDHFLSSDLMEPAGAQACYTEQLVRLPNLSIAYEPMPVEPAPITRAELGVPEDATLYWCCQSLYKYLPRHDDVFPRIARANPAARFLFIAYPGDPAVTQVFRDRLDAAFAAEGLDAASYCRFLPHMDPARFAGVTAAADLFLDSIGWSGCNSTLEALGQGLPVVTLAGELMRGRHSAAILTMLGMPELIAADDAAYVALAAALGRDPARRAALRERILADRQRLYRDPACIDGLARYLEEAVRR